MTLSNVEVVSLLPAQRASTTQTGADVALAGFINPAKRQFKAVLAYDSTGADADETMDVKIQESPTTVATDFVDITGAVFTQVTQPGAAGVQSIHFSTLASSLYVRAVATLAGTTPQFDFSVLMAGEARYIP